MSVIKDTRREDRSKALDKTQTLIQFGSYNIRNGQNGGIESALRGVSKANLDLGVLQETNITDGIFNHRSSGYIIVAMDVTS